MEKTGIRICSCPANLKEPISDGATNLATAMASIFYNNRLKDDQQVKRVRDITFDGERHNNKMKAFNGDTIRDREKVMRGIESNESPVF